MASPAHSSPSTPNPRRSASLPVKPASSPDGQIEVLFNLPSARIVAFTTGSSSARPSSSNGSPVREEEPGTLPWTSRFERTIAFGPLRIYRAPGSVAFLNCSNALRPILPKSQCWEVDASGKFVLQIRRPQYWRIEAPNKSPVERVQIEELKEVLANVLLFEKTPCPFQREFTIELPEAPQTPVKKRPWKPVERPRLDTIPLAETPDNDDCPVAKSVAVDWPVTSTPTTPRPPKGIIPESLVSTTVAKIDSETSKLSRRSSLPVDELSEFSGLEISSKEAPAETTVPDAESSTESAEMVSDTASDESESTFDDQHDSEDVSSFSDTTDDTNMTPRSSLQPAFQSLSYELEKETKPQALQNCSRSITAPPVLSLITSPPSKHRRKSSTKNPTMAESDSEFSSSVDSFYSVQSWHSPLAPPSPPASDSSSPTSIFPFPHDDIVLPKRLNHTRDASGITVTPDPLAWEMSPIPDMDVKFGSISAQPKMSTLVDEGSDKSAEEKSEFTTPPATRPSIRHRATTSSNSRRRTLSPLPAAVNLFSPPRRRSRRLQTARHLPTAIIQKTCEILLSPPSHLLQLMLSIASKIAAGEWRGVLSGHGEAVHWDFEDEYGGDGWHEDDFGISLGKPIKRKNTISGGSWEVD